MMRQSGEKSACSSAVDLMNSVEANRLCQASSVTTDTLIRYRSSAPAYPSNRYSSSFLDR